MDEVIYKIIMNTITMEGGFSDSKSDPGGLTMYGISARYNPEYKQKIASKTLTIKEAASIYYQKYWLKSGAPRLYQDGFTALAAIVFDCVVSGHRIVVRELQRYLNTKYKQTLVVDGICGPATCMTIVKCYHVDPDLERELIKHLNKFKNKLGSDIAKATMNTQRKRGLPVYDYTNGFTNRIAKRLNYAQEFIV